MSSESSYSAESEKFMRWESMVLIEANEKLAGPDP